jgi:Fe-S-cluster-containing hydrogenase component 2
MKRKIIKIDEEKCAGCGLCVNACVEGAIQMINEKARLVSDSYCDGLGACIGECPYDAISIEEREAEAFNEAEVHKKAAHKTAVRAQSSCPGSSCPGSKIFSFNRTKTERQSANFAEQESELSQWPIQLHLLSPSAPFWNDSDIVIAADCTAFAFGAFHKRFLSGKKLIIMCPKLDDTAPYLEKLTEILKNNSVKSFTAVRMEVPCCGGVAKFAEAAIAQSGKKIPLKTVIIGINGEIKE